MRPSQIVRSFNFPPSRSCDQNRKPIDHDEHLAENYFRKETHFTYSKQIISQKGVSQDNFLGHTSQISSTFSSACQKSVCMHDSETTVFSPSTAEFKKSQEPNRKPEPSNLRSKQIMFRVIPSGKYTVTAYKPKHSTHNSMEIERISKNMTLGKTVILQQVRTYTISKPPGSTTNEYVSNSIPGNGIETGATHMTSGSDHCSNIHKSNKKDSSSFENTKVSNHPCLSLHNTFPSCISVNTLQSHASTSPQIFPNLIGSNGKIDVSKIPQVQVTNPSEFRVKVKCPLSNCTTHPYHASSSPLVISNKIGDSTKTNLTNGQGLHPIHFTPLQREGNIKPTEQRVKKYMTDTFSQTDLYSLIRPGYLVQMVLAKQRTSVNSAPNTPFPTRSNLTYTGKGEPQEKKLRLDPECPASGSSVCRYPNQLPSIHQIDRPSISSKALHRPLPNSFIQPKEEHHGTSGQYCFENKNYFDCAQGTNQNKNMPLENSGVYTDEYDKLLQEVYEELVECLMNVENKQNP